MSVKNFIPQLWSARLQQHLDKQHVYGNVVNRDYEGEIKAYGDTVKINQLGNITISDYTRNKDMADAEELTGVQKLLVIDQAKSFNFQIDDVDNAQTNPKLMDSAMQRASYALNDVTDKFIANMYTEVDSKNVIGSDDAPIVLDNKANTAYDILVDMSILLDEANVPMEGRFCIVPPWVHGLLRKDDRFVHATEMGDSILRNGLIGEAGGFAIYKSNNVPNADGSKYKIMGGHQMAISFAEQIVEVEAYRPEKRFADAVKGLHVYGAKVIQPTALVVTTANKKGAEA